MLFLSERLAVMFV